jgi:hypothetical protein
MSFDIKEFCEEQFIRAGELIVIVPFPFKFPFCNNKDPEIIVKVELKFGEPPVTVNPPFPESVIC